MFNVTAQKAIAIGLHAGVDSEGGPGGLGPPVRSYDNYKI